MRRRLFQRLEQRVETVRRQHVHLIDEVHLVTPLGWRVLDVVQQFASVFHLGARSGIDLDQIDEAAAIDIAAGLALATGLGAHALLAIEALGENPRQRRLADTASPGKQIGVMQSPLVERIDQSTADMLLTDQFVEGTRAPFTGQNLVTHAARYSSQIGSRLDVMVRNRHDHDRNIVASIGHPEVIGPF